MTKGINCFLSLDVKSKQRYKAKISVSGVFADDQANGGWLLLGFDATLDAGCGFWEHLHGLKAVKGLQYCSKILKMGI